MRKFKVIKEYEGMKVIDYLKDVEFYSGRILRDVKIFINKKQVKDKRKKIKEGNFITVYEKEKGTDIKPMELPLNVVFENRDLLIVDKEPYIITHPTKKKVDITLANGVVYYFLKKLGKTVVPRFYNRLDMNTSGLIVIAKNGYSQAYLQNHGEVEKKYFALVNGIVEEDHFMIDKMIDVSSDGIKRVAGSRGQEAKSEVWVRNRNIEKNMSLIEVKLYTGRTHQIRVHLSSVGHPILGDLLYGGEREGIKRQLLHSYYIEFNDPETRERVKVESDLPFDIKEMLI